MLPFTRCKARVYVWTARFGGGKAIQVRVHLGRNIVATVNLGCQLELKKIALYVRLLLHVTVSHCALSCGASLSLSIHFFDMAKMDANIQPGCPRMVRFLLGQARNAEYNPKRFAAVIIRIRDPKTTALVFRSGKVTKIIILRNHVRMGG